MFTSVIIPTYKRSKDLEVTLDSICKQTILPNETIIIDQSPDDETKILCMQKKYKKILMKYFWIDDLSSARARNRGIEELCKESEITLFFDDDVELESDYIFEVIKFFENNPKALGGGARNTNIPKIYRFLYYLQLPFIKGYISPEDAQFINKYNIQEVSILIGYGMFLRTNIIRKKYQFYNWMDRYSYEDMFFTMNISLDYPNKLFYLPTAKIKHFGSLLGRIKKKEQFKQGIIHMYLFHKYFSLSMIRFVWWSILWCFINIFFARTYRYLSWILETIIYIIKNRKKIEETPEIINDFIFGNK